MTTTDALVTHGDVCLATTDHGGDGPALVLMHGLGDTRRGLVPLASRLTGLRVITTDLRGHGRSTTAAWGFEGAIADLEAVIHHYALDSPYVGGHSLGGMVALQYARTGRPVAGVINIDGWGPGIAGRYEGEDPVVVQARLDKIATGDLSSRLAQLLSAVSRQSREGTTGQVLALLHDADVVAWHREVPCRSLAFNATAPATKVITRVMGAEAARLQEAHRRGLRRDLAAASLTHPALTVVELDATHGLHRTHADEVSEAVAAFALP